MKPQRLSSFFFFNDTATTEIYTLSLHDALPISGVERNDVGGQLRTGSRRLHDGVVLAGDDVSGCDDERRSCDPDRKSTRLNSSHSQISYAVFCLKKKNKPPDNLLQLLLRHTEHT